MSEPLKPKVKVKLIKGYQFMVTFPGVKGEGFEMDEPAPLGELDGPNASRVFAASIANCLSSSLLFCLSRSKVWVDDMETDAEPTVERDEGGYWRVKKVDVSIRAELHEPADRDRVNRCLEIFENYCVVSGGLRKGIEVGVSVNLA